MKDLIEKTFPKDEPVSLHLQGNVVEAERDQYGGIKALRFDTPRGPVVFRAADAYGTIKVLTPPPPKKVTRYMVSGTALGGAVNVEDIFDTEDDAKMYVEVVSEAGTKGHANLKIVPFEDLEDTSSFDRVLMLQKARREAA